MHPPPPALALVAVRKHLQSTLPWLVAPGRWVVDMAANLTLHFMKPEDAYERTQSADRMDAVMVITSAIGAIAAIIALFSHGWLAGLGLFLLSMIAFAMSRVFDLLADLLASVGKLEESKKPGRSEKGDDAAS